MSWSYPTPRIAGVTLLPATLYLCLSLMYLLT
nr:MAG TPA: Protein of unknown function (DUF817) [Caudoviricetes sp.]DAV43403.1 MAG TPA: Protein of unknown function (DUF817) [Caudoviricetes sp.]